MATQGQDLPPLLMLRAVPLPTFLRPPRRISVLSFDGRSTRKEVGRVGDERVEGLVLSSGDDDCCDEGCCDEGCC